MSVVSICYNSFWNTYLGKMHNVDYVHFHYCFIYVDTYLMSKITASVSHAYHQDHNLEIIVTKFNQSDQRNATLWSKYFIYFHSFLREESTCCMSFINESLLGLQESWWVLICKKQSNNHLLDIYFTTLTTVSKSFAIQL